ncbi:MAG: ATP-binding cassette domain-containing protein [Bacilli bacterium]|nr:ATP-binding cassette domain-containing protein [Bacilli bacterium]
MEMIFSRKDLSFKIPDKSITGIISTNKEIINYILSEEEYRKKISIVKRIHNNRYYNRNNYSLMLLEIKNNSLILKDEEKKIKDSLKIVGLKQNILNKNYYELSASEKELFHLALALLHNTEILIIENPFLGLDLKNEKRLSLLFRKMKDEYNKTIIFISNDSELLYKYTDYLIILKNDIVLLEGKTTELYKNISILKRNKIEIPKIVKITYLVKKNKGIKIDYHKDVRDIIKDIYKHV